MACGDGNGVAEREREGLGMATELQEGEGRLGGETGRRREKKKKKERKNGWVNCPLGKFLLEIFRFLKFYSF